MFNVCTCVYMTSLSVNDNTDDMRPHRPVWQGLFLSVCVCVQSVLNSSKVDILLYRYYSVFPARTSMHEIKVIMKEKNIYTTTNTYIYIYMYK